MNTHHPFREIQQFNQSWMVVIYAVLGFLLLLFIYGDIEQLVFGKPFGTRPAPDFLLLGGTIFVAGAMIFFRLLKLESEISRECVSFRWHPFQRSFHRIHWDEVEKAEIVNYGFVGFGIRRAPGGWVYNVSGNMGLRLRKKSGCTIILGTRRPVELGNYLKEIEAGKGLYR